MRIFIGRNSDGRTLESVDPKEAGDFCSMGESLDLSQIGFFARNTENPCCEGFCTHEVIRYELSLQGVQYPE